MPSRLSQVRKAVRPVLKGRMMLSGPAGAGKTRSALIAATVLAEGGKILGIDTEKESMLTYASDFEFDHLPWHPPFNVLELVGVLGEAGRDYAVIILDSSSHFWRKEGGVLDIAGGKFTGWKEARPVQEAFVEAILGCPAHMILAARSKVEHVQEQEGGRQVVKKLGMAVQQDDDMEYELNVAVELAMDHTATITKSRTTALPVGRAFKGGQVAEMAGIYRDWLKAGEPPAPKEIVENLLGRIEAMPEQTRRACKAEFFAKFGRPEQLRESSATHAEELVSRYESTFGGPDAQEPETAPQPEGPSVVAAQQDGAAMASETAVGEVWAAVEEAGITEDEFCGQLETAGVPTDAETPWTVDQLEAASRLADRLVSRKQPATAEPAQSASQLEAMIGGWDKPKVVSELNARRLPTAGRIDDLRDRLYRAMISVQPAEQAS